MATESVTQRKETQDEDGRGRPTEVDKKDANQSETKTENFLNAHISGDQGRAEGERSGVKGDNSFKLVIPFVLLVTEKSEREGRRYEMHMKSKPGFT